MANNRRSPRVSEKPKQRIGTLRKALIAGESSGDAVPFDMGQIKKKARVGQPFDDFLRQEDMLEEVHAAAIKRVANAVRKRRRSPS